MTYELAKQLKGAGFPQFGKVVRFADGHEWETSLRGDHLSGPEGDAYAPILSELIDACGERFEALIKQAGGWVAISNTEGYMMRQNFECVSTPEEAVANLWLALHPTVEILK